MKVSMNEVALLCTVGLSKSLVGDAFSGSRNLRGPCARDTSSENGPKFALKRWARFQVGTSVEPVYHTDVRVSINGVMLDMELLRRKFAY